MDSEKIKEAFAKAKQDIFLLQSQISDLKHELKDLKRTINNTTEDTTLRQITTTQHKDRQTTDRQQYDTSTHIFPLEALKRENTPISTGNKGVSTDRQTDRQFDTSTGNEGVHSQKFAQEQEKQPSVAFEQNTQHTPNNQINTLVDSLETIRLDLKLKLKTLTNQEFLTFKTLYQLQEQGFTVDYSLISKNLQLTESSIRDYIQRSIKKGMPIEKHKQNNKKVFLSLSPKLMKVASLPTINELRNN